MVGGQDPHGSRPTKLSLVERPPLSLVQTSGICLPLAGVSTSIWWDFSPMEVRANHLCYSGKTLLWTVIARFVGKVQELESGLATGVTGASPPTVTSMGSSFYLGGQVQGRRP
jgi:hypothetical protein